MAKAAAKTTALASSSASQQKLQASDGAPQDGFGYSVSLSATGDEAIVGAPFSSGKAYVFVRQRGTWVQQQELQASDGDSGDGFGWSVSLSALGDEAIVGAYGHNSYTGAAYVFVRQRGTWVQQQKLQASDGAPQDGFGLSVSLSALGDEAIVGAYGHNSYTGAAYVFVRQRGTWVQQQKLQAFNGVLYDEFGSSVSLSALGDKAIVGAPLGSGKAYVFVRQGGTWVEQQELQASNGVLYDEFGSSVSLSALGDKAIVGAPLYNNGTGSADVFVRQGGTWVPQQELQASDGDSGDGFGWSVSLSALGDKAIVGAIGDSAIAVGSGNLDGLAGAYVFVRQGGTWVQHQELQAFNGVPGDTFGFAVSLSALGDKAIVGAPFAHPGPRPNGAAYVFDGI